MGKTLGLVIDGFYEVRPVRTIWGSVAAGDAGVSPAGKAIALMVKVL
ncbi:MAG: hypothetical protein ACI4BD_08720 [Paludibacteraceae bacterium]